MIGEQFTGKNGGRFTVIGEIGRGGFGVVYLAEDDRKRPFALKIITPVSDPAARLSFQKEIESTLGLKHPNLLEIVDFGTCVISGQQALFAVSELCPDGDYRSVLSGSTPQDRGVEAVAADFKQILMGLEVLHTRIVHRDLKPENVLVSGSLLKIGDFGLAKFVDDATRTFTFKGAGTPRYMAPEVWLAERVTPATDLYAIGIMFYEALCGQPPFAAHDVNALRNLHLYTPPARVKSINNAVPPFLDGIIRKLLEKDPLRRFQTAKEVLSALQETVPESKPAVDALTARMRQAHDAEEARRLENERNLRAAQDELAKNKYKEHEVLELIDDVVLEINSHLVETKIRTASNADGKDYAFGPRILKVRFFAPNQLYTNPIVPGRMEVLRKRHVVHGGNIEVVEQGQDREGWNLVLVRPADNIYGEWRIVESRLSPFSGRGTAYEPVATDAQLFADNLSCHWTPAMHTWSLKDKRLEREDVLNIFDVFIR